MLAIHTASDIKPPHGVTKNQKKIGEQSYPIWALI